MFTRTDCYDFCERVEYDCYNHKKNQDWLLDFNAIIHVCHDKNIFKAYSKAKDSEKGVNEQLCCNKNFKKTKSWN